MMQNLIVPKYSGSGTKFNLRVSRLHLNLADFIRDLHDHARKIGPKNIRNLHKIIGGLPN